MIQVRIIQRQVLTVCILETIPYKANSMSSRKVIKPIILITCSSHIYLFLFSNIIMTYLELLNSRKFLLFQTIRSHIRCLILLLLFLFLFLLVFVFLLFFCCCFFCFTFVCVFYWWRKPEVDIIVKFGTGPDHSIRVVGYIWVKVRVMAFSATFNNNISAISWR